MPPRGCAAACASPPGARRRAACATGCSVPCSWLQRDHRPDGLGERQPGHAHGARSSLAVPRVGGARPRCSCSICWSRRGWLRPRLPHGRGLCAHRQQAAAARVSARTTAATTAPTATPSAPSRRCSRGSRSRAKGRGRPRHHRPRMHRLRRCCVDAARRLRFTHRFDPEGLTMNSAPAQDSPRAAARPLRRRHRPGPRRRQAADRPSSWRACATARRSTRTTRPGNFHQERDHPVRATTATVQQPPLIPHTTMLPDHQELQQVPGLPRLAETNTAAPPGPASRTSSRVTGRSSRQRSARAASLLPQCHVPTDAGQAAGGRTTSSFSRGLRR